MISTTTSTLGDIGKVCMCKRIMKEQTSPEGDIPFYKISTFGEKADCYISREIYEDYKTRFSFPKKGDILISAAGTLGRTVIYDGEDAFFQDSNIVWIENDETKVLNDYLYYFYQTNPWVKTFGSTIPRLYNDNIRSVRITYPSNMEDQKKAVAVLKVLDTKISNNTAICSDLEAMAKLIYDYWFVQFDFPDDNGKPYKSSGGKMVWNEELKRVIPEGWVVKPFSSLCSMMNGINYDKNEIGDKEYRIANVRNITASSLLMDENDFDSIVLKSSSADRYVVSKDDILIARSGTPGAVRLIQNPSANTIFCGFIIRCVPNDLSNRLYLTYSMKNCNKNRWFYSTKCKPRYSW